MKKSLFKDSLIPAYVFILTALLLSGIIGSRAVTTLAENAPIQDRKCVVIDAGHGGIDGGATSCTGALESQLNLEIALRLNDLMHLLGVDTLMIRTTDISVYTEGETIAAKKVSDLKQRVKIVNETENAILISIHQNYYSDGRYSGAQVFYGAEQGSEDFAKSLQSMLVQTLNKGSNRQVKKASGVYLMENIDRLGILVECGFISNFQEEEKLRSDDYQRKLCCVIAAATSQYLYADTMA